MKLHHISEKKLDQADRDKLPKGEFAVPGKKAYPIPDRSHAANALARSSGKKVASKVKKKVCSKYPDMNSCSEGFARYVAAVMRIIESGPEDGWKANLNAEPVIINQQQADGSVKKIRVVKYWVDMVSPDGQRMKFKVGKGADGHPVFTDDRATKTGAAPLTNRGPTPGEQYTKPGHEEKLTPTAWAGQVERLIGPAEIGKIFVGLVKAGFKPG